jgi:hypothetical protein
MSTNTNIMAIRIFLCSGKYRINPPIKTIRNVMFDPLTTSICDMPDIRNESFIQLHMSSTFHRVIPSISHATSRGNHSKICFSRVLDSFSSGPIDSFFILLKLTTLAFQESHW